MTEVVDAAVAVILRADGKVLLGQRPAGKPWAGWWEFPGGKIETGETPLHGLQRELHEELGITAEIAYPWLTRTFAYPERTVKLHFFIVRAWHGEPHGREGQQIAWQDPWAVAVSPLLPANEPVMQALRLPATYAITDAHERGETAFLAALEKRLQQGLRMIQVREKQRDTDSLLALAEQVAALCRPYGAQVFLNAEPALARQAGVQGVHLASARLMALPEKPQGLLCAASCHTAEELARAAQLELDFVLLSPVRRTASHPEVPPIGWQGFAAMIRDYPLPVYALGGLQPADMAEARSHGAHGIAMQRAVWDA